MDIVTVTLGRNRSPQSSYAPNQPLGDGQWDSFREDVGLALARLTGPGTWIENHGGIAFWDNVAEESHKTAVLGAIVTPDALATLRNRLSVLAAKYDQDAIAVAVGTSDLVTARVAVPVAA